MSSEVLHIEAIRHQVGFRAPLIAAGFLLLLVSVPTVDTWLSPHPRFEPVGEEGNRWRREKDSLRFSDGTLLAFQEKELVRQSRVRTMLTPPWAALQLGVFGAGNDAVTIGEDGWLFLTERLRRGEGPTVEVAARPASVLAAVVRRFSSVGLDVVMLPVPAKATMYGTSLPSRRDVDTGAYARLVRELRERGIETINVQEIWERTPDVQPFCRTDTHWSFEGSFHIAHAICRELDLLSGTNTLESTPRETIPDAYELLAHLGMGGSRPRQDALWILRKTGFLHHMRRPVLPEDPTGLEWVSPESAPALLVGTSFSAWQGFSENLAYFSDHRIRTRALVAGGPFGAMGLELLAFRSGKLQHLPRTLIWEIPAFTLVVPRWLHWNEQIWRLLPATGYRRLIRQPPFHGKLVPGLHKISSPLSGHFAPGHVFHQGNGEISLRLSGQIQNGAAMVTVTCDGESLRAVWLPTDREVQIPAATTAFTGALISVHVAPFHCDEVTLRLDEVALTTDGREDQVQPTEQIRNARWAFKTPVMPSHRSAVRVRFPHGCAIGSRITVDCATTHRVFVLQQGARPGAAAYLNLEDLPKDARLVAVETKPPCPLMVDYLPPR